LPSAAATAQAGLVDLAHGSGLDVFGALKGLGGQAYFGAVALSGGKAPDAAFGGDGYTDPLNFTGEGVTRESQAEAVAVQPDGKVVVAGYLQEGIRRPTSFSPLLVRYAAEGSLDPTSVPAVWSGRGRRATTGRSSATSRSPPTGRS
jgi:hypothetical protein